MTGGLENRRMDVLCLHCIHLLNETHNEDCNYFIIHSKYTFFQNYDRNWVSLSVITSCDRWVWLYAHIQRKHSVKMYINLILKCFFSVFCFYWAVMESKNPHIVLNIIKITWLYIYIYIYSLYNNTIMFKMWFVLWKMVWLYAHMQRKQSMKSD